MLTATYLLKALSLDNNLRKLKLNNSSTIDDPLENPEGWTTVKPRNLENVVFCPVYKMNNKIGGFDTIKVYYKKLDKKTNYKK